MAMLQIGFLKTRHWIYQLIPYCHHITAAFVSLWILLYQCVMDIIHLLQVIMVRVEPCPSTELSLVLVKACTVFHQQQPKQEKVAQT